jgi:hypothetical protein
LQAELQAQKALFEAQNVQLLAQKAAFEAQEKRMAEMMTIMQSLGQATGVLVQLSAPPLPTPTTTPVSMKVHFSLVLCLCDIKPS